MSATLTDAEVRARVEVYLRARNSGDDPRRNMNLLYDCCPSHIDAQMNVIALEARHDASHEFHAWAKEWISEG